MTEELSNMDKIRNLTKYIMEPDLAEAIIEGIASGLVLVDNQGIIRYVNRRTEEIFGYSRHDLYGSHVNHLVPEDAKQVHGDLVKDFIANPSLRPMGTGVPIFGRRNDGKAIPLDISLCPIRMPSAQFVVASIRERAAIP